MTPTSEAQKLATREYQKRYYQENKAKVLQRQKLKYDALTPEARDDLNKKKREQAKRRRAANPDKAKAEYRRDSLRGRYGITHEQYEEMFAAQGGRCKLCKTDTPGGNGKHFHVDHCHDTKKVFALLCANCNTSIGLMGYDRDRLLKAIEYIDGTHRPTTIN